MNKNKSTNNKIFLIEDHDEALKVWRKTKVKNLDLVHLDAHIDFGFHSVKPIQKVFTEAKNLKDLKKGLEETIAFTRYEKDFDKQTNIGNYIYPAINEGIVRDFYWVVPGGSKEFKKSAKIIRNTLKGILRRRGEKKMSLRDEKKGWLSIQCLNRDFVVCTLDNLPLFEHDCLLDIDTDFLVMDSLKDSDNTAKIGKRIPWISSQDLVKILKKKIKSPEVITIAYSVNGGYTPIRYKHLGDEVASYFAPQEYNGRFTRNLRAAYYFNLFCSTHKKKYYQKAIRLNPTYRAPDNNYGPLYLARRKFSLANKEFSKVLIADPKNPACIFGLGNIALERKDFKKAKRLFSLVLKLSDNGLFKKTKEQGIFGLARAEFNLKNFKRAKELFLHYKAKEPLNPQSYCLLGRILEKEKDFTGAVNFYKDALKLGFYPLELLWRILAMSSYVTDRDGLIKFIISTYQAFKQRFLREKRINLKGGKKRKDLKITQKRMADLEKRLHKLNGSL